MAKIYNPVIFPSQNLLKATSTKNLFLDVIESLMYNEFFIQNKNSVSFSRYLDFCVFNESKNFKICDAIIGIAAE